MVSVPGRPLVERAVDEVGEGLGRVDVYASPFYDSYRVLGRDRNESQSEPRPLTVEGRKYVRSEMIGEPVFLGEEKEKRIRKKLKKRKVVGNCF